MGRPRTIDEYLEGFTAVPKSDWPRNSVAPRRCTWKTLSHARGLTRRVALS